VTESEFVSLFDDLSLAGWNAIHAIYGAAIPGLIMVPIALPISIMPIL
jgi:hypothetical protein